MTPDGWCTVFSARLDSLGGQDWALFSPEIPPNGPNPLKRGVTPLFHVFYLVYLYFFSWCRPMAQKGVLLTPKWEPC